MNDLEQAAFDVLPSLLQLKERLQEESEDHFTSVFMTGMRPCRPDASKHFTSVLAALPSSLHRAGCSIAADAARRPLACQVAAAMLSTLYCTSAHSAGEVSRTNTTSDFGM